MTSGSGVVTSFPMTRTFGPAPSADEIERIARAAMARLPAQFTEHLADIVLMVEDFADDETLVELGIDDPFGLTGVYKGTPLTERSVTDSGTLPDRIRLFRVPILDEWISSADQGEGGGEGESLEHLVAHVVVHEIGHHFGLSDADMHALEELAG